MSRIAVNNFQERKNVGAPLPQKYPKVIDYQEIGRRWARNGSVLVKIETLSWKSKKKPKNKKQKT